MDIVGSMLKKLATNEANDNRRPHCPRRKRGPPMLEELYKELRPHLRSEDELVERWRVQAREGFQIVRGGTSCLAAKGYRRYLNTLAWGHILYIDSLVVIAARHRKGLIARSQNLKRRRGGRDTMRSTLTPATSVTPPIWRTCAMGFVSTVTTSHGRSSVDELVISIWNCHSSLCRRNLHHPFMLKQLQVPRDWTLASRTISLL